MRFFIILIFMANLTMHAQSPGPAEVVQAQLDAYNAQDADAFAELFSADALVYMNIGDSLPAMSGRDAIREFYGNMFRKYPDNKSTIMSRVVQGNFVFDHEHITGRSTPMEIMAIYEVVGGMIVRVWFAR